MAAIIPPTKVGSGDRLSMTILLMAIFHGIIILGITFSGDEDKSETAPTLDVILVQNKSSSNPLKADYLAQVSQDGGGNSEQKLRPTDMFSAPTLSETPGVAPEQSIASINKIQQNNQQRLLTQQQSDYSVNTDPNISPHEEATPPSEQTPDYQAEIARLAAELDKTTEELTKKPREKFINSRTREHVAASYMRKWIDKVERIGNLNYPDEAVRSRLSGTLIMDVVINDKGELIKYNLQRSSGHKILDDAARRIISLASPFESFPEALKKQADIIHITRSWVFESDHSLSSH
ncbi:MAG: TonB family protein [Gammaproteobacteria bacterium]|nr:TonB family protein [Gammaproteobacteria bacterium]